MPIFAPKTYMSMEITVIVPVKDRRDHIGKTLDSIMKGSMQPKEVIIVDNESTDGTYQFCEQYIKSRPNMTLLHETFPGAAAACNKGLKSCKTEWVYFFNCDDLFDHNFIANFHDLDAENYDLIAVPTQVCNGRHRWVRPFIPSEDPRVQILADVFITSSMLIRTSYLKDIGAWNPACRIGEDWELGLRILLHQPRVMWYTQHVFHTLQEPKEHLQGGCYSMYYKEMVRTMTVAVNNLHSSILQPLSTYHSQHLACLYPHLDLLMYPFYLRICILLGILQREKMTGKCGKYKMAAKAITIFRNDNFAPTFSQRLTGHFMRIYTLLGGKGAWRFALAQSQKRQSMRKDS